MTLTVILALAAASILHAAPGIAGKIVEDHSGSPVASANVRIAKLGQKFLAADLETDREGRFEAQGLTSGDYRIDVLKPNFVRSSMQLHLSDATASSTIRLVKCAAIRGRVADQQGRLIDGATVFAIPKPANGLPARPLFHAGEQGRYSQVNDRGEYRIFNLPPGEYALIAAYGAYTMAVGMRGSSRVSTENGSGYLSYPENAHPQWFTFSGGEDLRNIDFAITSAGSYKVAGKVQAPPARGSYWVALVPLENPAIAIAVTTADQEGSFHFDKVPAGSYQALASGPSRSRASDGGMLEPDHAFARARIDVSQDVDGISLVPAKGETATITVESHGKCSGEPHVVLTALEDWGMALTRNESAPLGVETNIADLAPSRYNVGIAGVDCYAPNGMILDLTGGSRRIKLPLSPAGSIRGKLAGAGAVVVLLSQDSVRFATPDADGKFAFDAIRPGKYRIGARPPGSDSRWIADLTNILEVDVAPGASIEMDLAAPVVKR